MVISGVFLNIKCHLEKTCVDLFSLLPCMLFNNKNNDYLFISLGNMGLY